MIRSMTGFGRSRYEKDGREYIVEIKSVNHRYSDVSIKMPRSISYLEEKVKSTVLNNIARGKIDVFITFYNYSNKGKDVKINSEIAALYISELRKLAEENKINGEISVVDISRFPEVLNIENKEDEELIWNELSICLNESIKTFLEMREKEGEKLAKDFKIRIQSIEEKINKVSEYSTRLVEEYVVKLESRIKELLKTNVVDESRLAQEVVIYSDKCSIEEEVTRLKSHISQFIDLIKNSKIAIGKKLDFIIQEMNRETNTIGSKANNLDITNLVIEMKTEIENIREQVQNVE